MTRSAKVLRPLLSELLPRLAEQGFGESDVDSVSDRCVMFARVQLTYIERLSIEVESSPGAQGEWSLRAMCGIEFHDLERNRYWIGIPETHSRDLVLKSFGCRPSTNWRELSANLSAWIAEAFRVIANDSESIRQTHLRFMENRTEYTCGRLSFWSSKYEETRKPKVPWDVYQVCSSMLMTKEPSFEVLKRVEPSAVTNDLISSLLNTAAKTTRLLHAALGKYDEGQCDHLAIPHHGVIRYAFWWFIPRKLYLAVAQDGPNAPLVLILGASDIPFVRPVPQLTTLAIPTHTPGPPKSVKKTRSLNAVSKAVKLLAKPEPAFVELRLFEFEDDADAHDEGLIEERYAEFTESFNKAVVSLTKKFGPPVRGARGEQVDIPHCGIMQYSLWDVEDRGLYVAWCHEDRELPIMLVLGTLPA